MLFGRGRLRPLVLLAACGVAALLVAWSTMRAPTEYESSATISVVPPSDRDIPNLVTQRVNNYRAAVKTPGFAEGVAAATGVSPTAVRRGISADKVGLSTLVRVAFRSTERAKVAEVVKVAIEQAFVTLRSADAASATAELASAERRHAEAVKALEEFTRETGMVFPEEQVRSLVSQIFALKLSTEQATAEGDVARADRLNAAMAERNATLAALAEPTRRYRALVDEEKRSADRLAEVVDRLRPAQRPAPGDRELLIDPPRPIPKIPLAIRAAAVGGVLAAIACIGMFTILELMVASPDTPRRAWRPGVRRKLVPAVDRRPASPGASPSPGPTTPRSWGADHRSHEEGTVVAVPHRRAAPAPHPSVSAKRPAP